MTDLQEVRRYWPKAKMSGQLLADGAAVWTVYVSDSSRRLRIVVYADGTAAAGVGLLPIQSQPTIHEAMRAAGFGRRPLGEFASRLKRTRTVLYRRGTYRVIATIDWQPLPVHTQRPRKGARLGRRKREALRRIEEPEDCSSVTKYGATGAGAWCARQAGVM